MWCELPDISSYITHFVCGVHAGPAATGACMSGPSTKTVGAATVDNAPLCTTLVHQARMVGMQSPSDAGSVQRMLYNDLCRVYMYRSGSTSGRLGSSKNTLSDMLYTIQREALLYAAENFVVYSHAIQQQTRILLNASACPVLNTQHALAVNISFTIMYSDVSSMKLAGRKLPRQPADCVPVSA